MPHEVDRDRPTSVLEHPRIIRLLDIKVVVLATTGDGQIPSSYVAIGPHARPAVDEIPAGVFAELDGSTDIAVANSGTRRVVRNIRPHWADPLNVRVWWAGRQAVRQLRDNLQTPAAPAE